MNEFIQRYKELCPDFELVKTIRPSLRINTLKIDEERLVKRLKENKVQLEKIPFLKFGYYYDAKFSLGATPEYLLGYYYLQEAASQIPAEILDPKEDELVLDMACAPGSKITQIAQLMNNKGAIIGLDNDAHRLFSVRNNIERLGIKNIILYKKDSRFVFDLKQGFDKILLDAPCSGNYLVEPGYFKIKTLQGIKERSRLQKELLKAAMKVLKPNGILVYSTCSLEPEENELVIDWLLNKFNNLILEDIEINIGDPGFTHVFGQKLNPEITKCKRFWPHRTGTEGFFVAKIRKF